MANGVLMPKAGIMQGKSFLPILTGEAPADHHKDKIYTEFYFSTMLMHKIYATMMFDGRYKIAIHHGEDICELYDLENDPNEFHNLWNNPEYAALQTRLTKECFDHAILCNIDRVMGCRFNY